MNTESSPKSHKKLVDLSVIIVSYNTADLTVQTIESVFASAALSPELKIEVIVVDNNSSDTSQSKLTKLSKKSPIPLKLIENKTNDGFSAANNQGIKKAQGEYILLLNSDTVVIDTALAALVATFKHYPSDETTADLSSYHGKIDRIGIAAARLLNPDGSTQHQGGSFPALLSLATHLLLLDDIPIIGKLLPSTQATGKRSVTNNSNNLIPRDWVGGTAMMFPKVLVTKIGNLDSNIFMYGEDIEFCMRAKHHNYDVVINPKSIITHYGNASGSSIKAIIGELKGYLYIWSKHKPHWQYPLVKAMIITGCRLRMLLFDTIIGEKKRAAPYEQALSEISSL